MPALPHGVGGDWHNHNGDTPPGLYMAGEIKYTEKNEPQLIWDEYGSTFIYLIEQWLNKIKVFLMQVLLQYLK